MFSNQSLKFPVCECVSVGEAEVNRHTAIKTEYIEYRPTAACFLNLRVTLINVHKKGTLLNLTLHPLLPT